MKKKGRTVHKGGRPRPYKSPGGLSAARQWKRYANRQLHARADELYSEGSRSAMAKAIYYGAKLDKPEHRKRPHRGGRVHF